MRTAITVKLCLLAHKFIRIILLGNNPLFVEEG